MSSLRNVLLRLARCTSGTATIEAAMIMPIAIGLMAGGIEFGRLYSVWSTADKSMRDAARYLARVCDPNNFTGSCTTASGVCGWGFTNAQYLAVYGTLAITKDRQGNITNQPLIPNWQIANVTLLQPTSCATLPTIIQLTATVPFGAIMNYVPLPNSFTVQHEEAWIGQ